MEGKTIDDERFDRVKKAQRKVKSAKAKVRKAALGVAEAEDELKAAIRDWQVGDDDAA